MPSDPSEKPIPSEYTQEQQQPYHFAEVSPDKILVRPETIDMFDGMLLEKAVWEPLLGGELNAVWDSLLTEPGDEVCIKGSLVVKMAIGGYVVNKETGLADPALRSDCDIILDNPDLIARASNLGLNFGGTTNKAASAVKMGDLNIEFVSEPMLRETDIASLNELADILEKVAPEQTDLVERLHATCEAVSKASTRDMLIYDNLYPHESMMLRLRRGNDKELEVYFEDPAGLLLRPEAIMNLYKSKMDGYFYGVSFEEPNLNSIAALYMEGFSHLKDVEFHTFAPVWAVNPFARMIKSACELDVEEVGIRPESFFTAEVNLARRIVDGDLKVRVVADNGEVVDVRERLGSKVQYFFARGCASNLYLAYDYVFAHYPFGDFISSDLAEPYKEYHDEIPPNTLVGLITSGVEVSDLPTELVPDMEALKTLIRYHGLVTKHFENRIKRYEMHSVGYTPEGETPLYFPDANLHPEGMSEVMAMIFVAAQWDEGKDIDKIRTVIKNWQPTGNLTVSWKRLDYNWEMGLDENKILQAMKKFKESSND